MVVKTEQQLRDAAQKLGSGFLGDAFAGRKPFDAIGLDEETYKAYLAQPDSAIAQSVLKHLLPEGKDGERKEEKDKNHRAYEQMVLREQLRDQNRKLDEQIGKILDIIAYHKKQEEIQKARRETALDDLERFRKTKDSLDKVLKDDLLSKGRLDRENANKALEAAGLNVPEGATDDDVRKLLKKAKDDTEVSIVRAGVEYDDADRAVQEHGAEVEKHEALLNEVFKEREAYVDLGLSDAELKDKLKDLYARNEKLFQESKTKIDDPVLLKKISGFEFEQKPAATLPAVGKDLAGPRSEF